LQSYNPYYTGCEALELVLLSVLKQRKLPQEIIIGDDGSSQETAALVESFKIDLVFLNPLMARGS
jgi:glycosyltransferase involved in cell wall biosynthesis